MLPKYTITPRSNNAKTGPLLVTTSPRTTCPPSCALRNNGCYADSGPIRRIWDRLTATDAGATFPNGATGKVQVHDNDSLLTYIRRQYRALWRHNQAGDLHGQGGRIDAPTLRSIADANHAAEARGFTYTHYSVLGKSPMAAHNRQAISDAVARGFAVNLSANNPRTADKLLALNIAPVAAIVPHTTKTGDTTPAGRKIVVCPAMESEHVTCYNCGRCADLQRDYIVGFWAHGNSAKKAEALAAS